MSNSRVTKFNHICGNAPSMGTEQEYWKQVQNQVKRVMEEVKELYECAMTEDIEGVLDGYLDVKYTNEYIDDLLKADGVRTNEAWELVCDNNESKFTNSYSYAVDSKEYHEQSGTDCYIDSVVYEGETFYCIRRSYDNKVLKPKYFEAVDLSSCLHKRD